MKNRVEQKIRNGERVDTHDEACLAAEEERNARIIAEINAEELAKKQRQQNTPPKIERSKTIKERWRDLIIMYVIMALVIGFFAYVVFMENIKIALLCGLGFPFGIVLVFLIILIKDTIQESRSEQRKYDDLAERLEMINKNLKRK